MGYEYGSGSHHDRDSDDEEDYDEAGGGNRLLGFMFGNVDNSGELDVDYLDKDAKEHLDALADKLGASLTGIDLSGKSPHTSVATAEEDYDEKAEDAVDYEDIEEQYEGPETEIATEEDHLLPKKEYFPTDMSATLEQRSSIFDDENYDEDEDEDTEKESEAEIHSCKDEVFAMPDSLLNQQDQDKIELVDNHSVEAIATAALLEILSEEQADKDEVVLKGALNSESLLLPGQVQTEIVDDFTNFDEEEPAASNDATNAKSLMPLPILCMEDGLPILRFSEIFGVNEPLKKAGKREQKYCIPKDKYMTLASLHMVEDDEITFLKGSRPILSHRKQSREPFEGNEEFTEENSEFANYDETQGTRTTPDARKDYCQSAEPMRNDLAIDLSVEQRSCLSMEFYSLDQQQWEDAIIWGNSPSASENFVESCDLSGPDSESAFHEEREIISRSGNNWSIKKVIQDEKDKICHVDLSSVSVEPFGSRDFGAVANISETKYHPQLLRLESQVETNTSKLSDNRKELESEQNQQFDLMRRFYQLSLQNKELVEGSWVDNIVWGLEPRLPKPKLILDLQDERMVFEISDNKDYEHLQHHAGAMIMTRNKKAGTDSNELPRHMSLSGGRFNIGNDKYYSNRKTSPQLKSMSKKRAAHSVKVLHSIPALKLETMKPKLSNKDIAHFHRPKATWYPHDNEVAIKELGKLPMKGTVKVILKSLGGKGCKIQVDAEETVTSLKSKASKKLDFKLMEPVKIFCSGKELEDQKTLVEQDVRPNSLLHLVRTRVHLLPMAQKLPNENKSLRPPGAFKKKSDLSVKDGHIFLMEYCEEKPLLLGNAGMGARLCTYYQKSSSDDQTGDMQRNSNSGLGTFLTLDPADKSPFLGDLKPSCSQSCLETNMYRAPVFPQRVASTDYLLVRSAKGKLSIRRIDKIHVVGQQEPHMEVMAPGAKGLLNYIMNRLVVYVYREFRASEKRGMLPWIRADELYALFPEISEQFLRKRLKHCADLQRGRNGQLYWVMRRNFHIPPEEELRRIVTPETVCAYESMQAGKYRLKRLGITSLAHVTGPTNLGVLSSAINQLPADAIALAAASHIERELQITPWNLSANFVACMSQDRGYIERLEISGVGDPTGRGLGFSYVRLATRTPPMNAVVKKKLIVARGTTVTGTDADLRRLSMEAAREVLVKFNIAEEQIEKQSRWHRIAMIRDLSNEQAASGVKVDPSTTASKYARGHRMSFSQLQQQNRDKCQEIWDRQIQSLSAVEGEENESDSEANSDLDSFAGDLENLLDGEEGEEGEESNLDMRNCKSDGVKGLKMRRHSSQARLEEELEDEASEAAELCRILMDDDNAQWKKKKKKSKPTGEALGMVRAPSSNFVFENVEQIRKPNTTDGPALSDAPSMLKKNATDLMEVEQSHSKKTIAKAKATKKNEVLPVSLFNKKVKIMTEGVKVFKEKKSARDIFVCGACKQLGHMRTNKNCPKYREDPEAQTNMDQEKESANKPIPQDPSQSQQKIPPKKLVSKSATKVSQVEALDGEKSSAKAKVLKVRCASTDKVLDKAPAFPSLSSDQPSTSEAENKSAHKVIKIVSNKTKADDTQVESHKQLNLVIRPPSEATKDQPHKKITIRQPKEVINLDYSGQDGADLEYRKTRKIIDLTGYNQNAQQDSNYHLAEEAARKKHKEARIMWEEEEERRRNVEIMQEERARRLYEEEMRRIEEQERLDELRKYQEDIRREREEEEHRKAMKKKKKTKRTTELQDDYFDDFQSKRNNRLLPERDRTAKRKTVVEFGRYGAEYVPPTKRRKGGEVGLANILETVVETLKERRDISYLFLKPVSKKEAPDYLNIIKRPMDLSAIREKIRRLEYKDRIEFRHDVWQITYNAHAYNDGRNPGIPPLADQLLEICDYLLEENADGLEEAEASIRDI